MFLQTLFTIIILSTDNIIEIELLLFGWTKYLHII